MTAMIMQSGDTARAATLMLDVLRPAIESDWTARAGELDWSCRRTLDHVVDTLLFLAGGAATRAAQRRFPVRNGDPRATVPALLEAVETSASILEVICAGMSPHERGFHPAGRPDADGFRAQATSEIIQHTYDITQGLDLDWRPPIQLCDRVVRRLFPWAPDKSSCPDRFEALLWACGRISLPAHPRLAPDWWTHPAPLDEWDGTRKIRMVPPA
ncbi:MAG TPA: hypothetical protein VGR08_05550 [Thermomicrobiales bacterium]|nr:hypothetical protein [Thermomicrobiales bacterium]